MQSHKRGFEHQQVGELSQQIDFYHDQFLEAEDFEKKMEALRLMKGYTTQYLYLVPHNKKFMFPETVRVLANSVAVVDDFDPREASAAFESLAKYAHNLYEQPWRKEFMKIKLTSGFYIHNIRANLSNAQELLVQLQYASIDDTTLVLTSLPDTKRLKAFSRDCFIACQECVILSQIWERFQQKVPDYMFTVQDAFQARCSLAGDLETILNTLLYEAQRRQREHNLKLEETRRKHEEEELIRIQLQREEALIERQIEEKRELERQQREEDRYTRERQKRMQDEQKATREVEVHKQTECGRKPKHVPIERLIDIDDERSPSPVSETEEAVKHVLKNTERERYGVTEYKNKFSDKTSKTASVHQNHNHTHRPQHQPSKNLTNGVEKGRDRDLKELQDVAFDYHLNQNSYSDNLAGTDVVDRNRSLDENVENFEKISSRVDEVRSRRTNNVQQSTVARKDEYTATSSSYPHSSSGFKSLKAKQDLPKTTSSVDTNSSSSLASFGSHASSKPDKSYHLRNSVPKTDGYRNGSGSCSGSDVGAVAESEFKKPKEHALTKIKVPVESKSPEYEFDSPKARAASSSPSCEVGRDILNTSLYNDLHALNLNELGVSKNVSDKDMALAIQSDEKKKSSNNYKWQCPHCTFKNKRALNICEACFKSSDFKMDSDSDSAPEEDSKATTATYASVSRKDKSKSKSISPVEGPVLKLSSREMTPKDMKDFPTLETSLSARKFRDGFGGLGDGDENCNRDGLVEWVCSQCTFKNPKFARRCEMCDYVVVK